MASGGGVGRGPVRSRGSGLVAPCSSIPAVVGRWQGNRVYICSQPTNQRRDAKITEGYLLPAAHVIHTVGPVWRGGNEGEDELLARCYRRSLAVALQNGLLTIAFPVISGFCWLNPPRSGA